MAWRGPNWEKLGTSRTNWRQAENHHLGLGVLRDPLGHLQVDSFSGGRRASAASTTRCSVAPHEYVGQSNGIRDFSHCSRSNRANFRGSIPSSSSNLKPSARFQNGPRVSRPFRLWTGALRADILVALERKPNSPDKRLKSQWRKARMSTPTPALNLKSILEGVPRGAWVAISTQDMRVIAYGSEMRKVLEEAKSKGESNPLMTRVPETTTTLIF